MHDKMVNGLSQLHSNIYNEVFHEYYVALQASEHFKQNPGQEVAIESSGSAVVRFLTAIRGPLLSAIEAPGKMRKTDQAADQAFLQALARASKDKRSPEGVFMGYDKLRGRRAFNGSRGGPYGNYVSEGKLVSAANTVCEDFVARGRGDCPAFGICHYSTIESNYVCEVAYDAREIINDDSCILTEDMAACLSSSPMLSAYGDLQAFRSSATRDFVDTLYTIKDVIERSNGTFVQCLRANDERKEMEFNATDVAAQLRFSPIGVILSQV